MESQTGFSDPAPPVPVPRIRKQLKTPKLQNEHSGINTQIAPRIIPPKRRKKSNTSSELEYIMYATNETEMECSHVNSEGGLIDKTPGCNKITVINSVDTFNLAAECPDRINNYFNFVKPKPYYPSSNTLYTAKMSDTQEDDDSGVYFAESTSLESQKYDQSEVKQNVTTDAKYGENFQNESNYSNNLRNGSNKQNSDLFKGIYTHTNQQITNKNTPAALHTSSECDDQVDPYCSTNISQDSDNKNLKTKEIIGYVTSCCSKANIVQNEQYRSKEDNGDVPHVLALSDRSHSTALDNSCKKLYDKTDFKEYSTENTECTVKETSFNLNCGNNGSHKELAINNDDITEIVDRFLLLDVQDCSSSEPRELKENVGQQKYKLPHKEELPKTKEDPLVEISKKFSMFLCDMLGSSSLQNAVSDAVVQPLPTSHSWLSTVDINSKYENSKGQKTSVNEHFKSQRALRDKHSKCDKHFTNVVKQNNDGHIDVNKNVLAEVENRLDHSEEAHVRKDSENNTSNFLKSISIMDLPDESCSAEIDDSLPNNNVDNVNKSLEIECSNHVESDSKIGQSCRNHNSAVDDTEVSYLSTATEMESKLDGGGEAEIRKDSETNAIDVEKNVSVMDFTDVSSTTEVSTVLDTSNSNAISKTIQADCTNYVESDKKLDLLCNFQNSVAADNLETSYKLIATERESKLNIDEEEQMQKDYEANATNVKNISLMDSTDVISSKRSPVVLENSNSNSVSENLQTECSNHMEGNGELNLSYSFHNFVAGTIEASYQPSVIQTESKINLNEEAETQKDSETNTMKLVKNASGTDFLQENSYGEVPEFSENSIVDDLNEFLQPECCNYVEDNKELKLTWSSQNSVVDNSDIIEGNVPSETEGGTRSVLGHNKLLYGKSKEAIYELQNKNITVINTKKKSVKFNDTVNIINKVEYALQRNRSISIKEEKKVFKRDSWTTESCMKSKIREVAENDSDDSENMVEEHDLWKSYHEELCETPKKSSLPSFESFLAKSCGTVGIKTEEKKIHEHELWTSDNNQINKCRDTHLPSFESFISKTSKNIHTNQTQSSDQTELKHGKLTVFGSSISECEAHNSLPEAPSPPKCSAFHEILLDATFWTKQKSPDNVTGPPKSEYQ
ncbi:dual specificity protein kinase splB-like isoform X1 [Schistocerca cancellata]|uniref:dual specificity protein kinase splB-like isoform X1 n=1 Tax=Schistocerca cancellata TaxID=274614 RepID=UPI00211866C9|nr:dual specificity protein kinase splB-like isoform X1 [Schistocerca cancellata]